MIGLDTNVLLRFLVRDDSRQAVLAQKAMEHISRAGDTCYINVITLCEVLWVLRKSYCFEKKEILEMVHVILALDNMVVEDSELLIETFLKDNVGNIGFADLLIGLRNRAAGCKHTFTFDKKAGKLDAFKVLA